MNSNIKEQRSIAGLRANAAGLFPSRNKSDSTNSGINFRK